MRCGTTLWVAVGLAVLAMPGTASAAPITVNSGADPGATLDGACTLREAINSANDNNGGVSDCSHGSGASIRSFSLPHSP